MKALKRPRSLVMLLVPWKRLTFGPFVLIQVGDDVRPLGGGLDMSNDSGRRGSYTGGRKAVS